MGMIVIDCPSTGRAVSTGIETLSIERLPTVTAKIKCPVCGRLHEWTKDSARLVEDGEQYRTVAARASSLSNPACPSRHSTTCSVN